MSNNKTYKDLYGDIKHYMNRTDQDTLSRIPTWIHLAESQLDRTLRHPAAEKMVRYPLKKGEFIIPIPVKLLELKNLRNTDTGQILYRRSLETLYGTPLDSVYPTGYARKGVEYVLNKASEVDVEIEVIYYTAPQHLENPGDRNLYTMQCYDILMYYTLGEGFNYLHDIEKANLFTQKAAQSFEMLQKSIKDEEFSGSTLVHFYDSDGMNNYF